MTSPFIVNLTSSLLAETIITIRGYVPWNSKRFSVNFEANANAYQGNDIAFHFDIRFDQRSVVRNTRLNGEWGIEEIQVSKGTPAIPISKGQHFELTIFVLENQFKVAVNGEHFINYEHRIFYKLIHLIRIRGIVFINNVTHRVQTPVTLNEIQRPLLELINPKVPLSLDIPGELVYGKQIHIMGKPTKYASKFQIELKMGIDVLFHLTAIFGDYPDKDYITGQEKQRAERSPFVRNQCTDIVISCDNGGHHVTVNGAPCTYFQRPHAHMNKVANRLEITGDLHVSYVSLMQSAHASRTYYCNGQITTCD